MKNSNSGYMNCIKIKNYGGPENLKLSKLQIPIPKKNEILIKVIAAGVNRPDIMQRQGLYPPPEGVSPIPGLEISGIVKKVISSSSKFKSGDKVCALVSGGGYSNLTHVCYYYTNLSLLNSDLGNILCVI